MYILLLKHPRFKNLYTDDIKEGFVTVHVANSTPPLELASNQGGR